jgi:hypothetical protein
LATLATALAVVFDATVFGSGLGFAFENGYHGVSGVAPAMVALVALGALIGQVWGSFKSWDCFARHKFASGLSSAIVQCLQPGLIFGAEAAGWINLNS